MTRHVHRERAAIATRGRRARRLGVFRAAMAVTVAAAALTGCGSDGSDGAGGTTTGSESTTTGPASTTSAPEAGSGYYLSIGDSYAQGFQPGGRPADEGFAYQLPDLAREDGWDLELVNFGCGGATTRSLAESPGCREDARAPGGPVYEEPQLDAAIAFIEENPDEVALVTVSIGGNDVTACVADPDPVGCVTGAVEVIRDDLIPSLERLRAALGPEVPVIGLTYPNVILGAWVSGGEDLAGLSVIAFRDLINPALAEAYETIDATFVDITDGTGGYLPLEETTTLDPYGEVPVAVAEVCQLTWFCEEADIHARTEGYGVMAELIVEALPDP